MRARYLDYCGGFLSGACVVLLVVHILTGSTGLAALITLCLTANVIATLGRWQQ